MFNRLLHKYPMAVQSLTTCGLFIAGDMIAQFGVEKTTKYDPIRTLWLGSYGLVIAGPSVVTWYRFLSRVKLSSPVKSLALRVGMDQLLFAPTFLAVFFVFNGITQKNSIDQIRKKMKSGYVESLVTNWTVWPFVQVFNFKYIPLNYQTLLVNTVALGWNTYLSVLNQKTNLEINA